MADIAIATITTEVRTLINEPTPMLIADADITAWADEATNQMYDQGLLGEDILTKDLGTLSGPSSKYFTFGDVASSENFMPMAVLWMGADEALPGATTDAPYALTKTHIRQMAHNSTNELQASTKAIEWFWENERIYMFPQPGSDWSNNDIDIYCYTRIDTYSETTIPPYLQEYVIWYAVAMAFEKMRNYNVAEQYMSIFNNFLLFHRQDLLYDRTNAKDEMKQQDRTRVLQ